MRWTKETFKDYWRSENASEFWNDEWRKGKYIEELKKIIPFLKEIKWQSLHEIGCGNGKNLEFMLINIPGKVLSGTDINIKLLEEADKKTLRVDECDTEHLKLISSPDVIFSYEHLQHLHPEAFKNAVKAIKDTGAKYIFLYEGHMPDKTEGVIKSGEGGRWHHDYQKHFPDTVKINIDNDYITLLSKL